MMQRLLQPQAVNCSKNKSTVRENETWLATLEALMCDIRLPSSVPLTLTRYTSSTRLSSPSNETVGPCARGFTLGGIGFFGEFFFLLCFSPTLPFSIADVHLSQPARFLSRAFIRHVKSVLSAFLSLHPLTPPGSGTLWAP